MPREALREVGQHRLKFMSNENFFPGIQEGERILYFAKPHVGMKFVIFGGVVLASLFLVLTTQIIIGAIFPSPSVQLAALVITVLIVAATLWWVHVLHEGQKYYITDRRAVRFAPTTPFYTSTRSIFWDYATKLRTYYKYPVIQPLLKVGSITINAKETVEDDLEINHVTFHHDLANYIDKIIYTFHNKPEELSNIRPFIPKPRGERY